MPGGRSRDPHLLPVSGRPLSLPRSRTGIPRTAGNRSRHGGRNVASRGSGRNRYDPEFQRRTSSCRSIHTPCDTPAQKRYTSADRCPGECISPDRRNPDAAQDERGSPSPALRETGSTEGERGRSGGPAAGDRESGQAHDRRSAGSPWRPLSSARK